MADDLATDLAIDVERIRELLDYLAERGMPDMAPSLRDGLDRIEQRLRDASDAAGAEAHLADEFRERAIAAEARLADAEAKAEAWHDQCKKWVEASNEDITRAERAEAEVARLREALRLYYKANSARGIERAELMRDANVAARAALAEPPIVEEGQPVSEQRRAERGPRAEGTESLSRTPAPSSTPPERCPTCGHDAWNGKCRDAWHTLVPRPWQQADERDPYGLPDGGYAKAEDEAWAEVQAEEP